MGTGHQHQGRWGGALERCPQVVDWLIYTSCGHGGKDGSERVRASKQHKASAQ